MKIQVTKYVCLSRARLYTTWHRSFPEQRRSLLQHLREIPSVSWSMHSYQLSKPTIAPQRTRVFDFRPMDINIIILVAGEANVGS
jgi:hypothetical protein